MSAPAWLAAAGLASLNPSPTDGSPTRAQSPYPGDFSGAPAQLWLEHLPGERVPSAIHTEAGGPLLHGPYLYTGTAGEDTLLVLDRTDGRLIRRLPARGLVRSTPVVADGHLFYGDAGGASWCWRLIDGVPAEEPTWVHVGTAPVLASLAPTADRIYVADVANVVVALDARTGDLAWRHAQKLDPGRKAELELYGHPPPALVGELLLAGFSDGTLVGLDASSGDLLWQRRVGEGQYPDLIADPLFIGGDVIVGGFTAPLVSMDLATRNIRWRIDEVGAAHGAALYRDADGQPGRQIFHGGVDGILRAVDRVTGAVDWEWDSKTRSALTRPLVTPAGLLVAAASGSLYLINAETGKKRWEWLPGFHVSGITATPAQEGRQLVAVTNAGNVVSLAVPEPQAERQANPLLRAMGL